MALGPIPLADVNATGLRQRDDGGRVTDRDVKGSRRRPEKNLRSTSCTHSATFNLAPHGVKEDGSGALVYLFQVGLIALVIVAVILIRGVWEFFLGIG